MSYTLQLVWDTELMRTVIGSLWWIVVLFDLYNLSKKSPCYFYSIGNDEKRTKQPKVCLESMLGGVLSLRKTML